MKWILVPTTDLSHRKMVGEFHAAGRRLAGRVDHDARVPPPSCTAIMSGRLPSPTPILLPEPDLCTDL
jgi:hypothetical protein